MVDTPVLLPWQNYQHKDRSESVFPMIGHFSHPTLTNRPKEGTWESCATIPWVFLTSVLGQTFQSDTYT